MFEEIQDVIKEEAEEIAQEIIYNNGNIDDLTKEITDYVNNTIKRNMLDFAYDYCDTQEYDLNE